MSHLIAQPVSQLFAYFHSRHGPAHNRMQRVDSAAPSGVILNDLDYRKFDFRFILYTTVVYERKPVELKSEPQLFEPYEYIPVQILSLDEARASSEDLIRKRALPRMLEEGVSQAVIPSRGVPYEPYHWYGSYEELKHDLIESEPGPNSQRTKLYLRQKRNRWFSTRT